MLCEYDCDGYFFRVEQETAIGWACCIMHTGLLMVQTAYIMDESKARTSSVHLPRIPFCESPRFKFVDIPT